MKILYLCTANICRSPAAEFYMRHILARLEIPQVEVSSAGIIDMQGASADPMVTRELKNRGIDMSSHQSKLATHEMLQQADEIVVMERRHRAWVREHHPMRLRKVSLIREPEESVDLFDPTGGTVKEYHRALEILFACLERRALVFKYPV